MEKDNNKEKSLLFKMIPVRKFHEGPRLQNKSSKIRTVFVFLYRNFLKIDNYFRTTRSKHMSRPKLYLV